MVVAQNFSCVHLIHWTFKTVFLRFWSFLGLFNSISEIFKACFPRMCRHNFSSILSQLILEHFNIPIKLSAYGDCWSGRPLRFKFLKRFATLCRGCGRKLSKLTDKYETGQFPLCFKIIYSTQISTERRKGLRLRSIQPSRLCKIACR